MEKHWKFCTTVNISNKAMRDDAADNIAGVFDPFASKMYSSGDEYEIMSRIYLPLAFDAYGKIRDFISVAVPLFSHPKKRHGYAFVDDDNWTMPILAQYGEYMNIYETEELLIEAEGLENMDWTKKDLEQEARKKYE